MRKTRDRIRHAISFELIALIIVVPLAGWVFGMPMTDIGVVAIVSSIVAMLWNYVFNLLFDKAMLRIAGHTRKSVVLRVCHAVLFEAGLLIALVPFIAWYLDLGLVQAFLMDVAFTVFFLIYAFIFNWVYDVVFPVPAIEG